MFNRIFIHLKRKVSMHEEGTISTVHGCSKELLHPGRRQKMFQNAPLGHCKTCEGKAERVGVFVGFFPTHLFSFVHAPRALVEGCEEYIAQSALW